METWEDFLETYEGGVFRDFPDAKTALAKIYAHEARVPYDDEYIALLCFRIEELEAQVRELVRFVEDHAVLETVMEGP